MFPDGTGTIDNLSQKGRTAGHGNPGGSYTRLEFGSFRGLIGYNEIPHRYQGMEL